MIKRSFGKMDLLVFLLVQEGWESNSHAFVESFFEKKSKDLCWRGIISGERLFKSNTGRGIFWNS